MSWQDDLRRLDEELATGRISADDYRSRRDQIMATAVSPAAGQDTPPSESTTVMSPVQPGQQAPGPAADADQTQIVSGQQTDSDRTQAVGWRASPPDDPNRTQVVPGVPPQSFAGARPPRPAPGQDPNLPPWQQEEQLPPPWAGQDFPPLVAHNTPDWALQGPEVFESEKKGGAGKVIAIVAIVVVLVGVAVGAYFLFGKDNNQAGGSPGGETSSSQPPTTTSEKPKGPIVELPGEVADMADVNTFEKVVDLNYLTKEEIGVYQEGVAAASTIALAKDGEIQIVVLVTEQADEAAAATAAEGLDAIQQEFNKMKTREVPAGVLASENQKASRGPIIRAHYASEDKVVRVQVQGPDLDQVNEVFDTILDAQLERLPANA
ncbi:hypothetical protein [Actinophytocola sp. NPDC049390]|uniref:hypothetical protein n=1 Tax=Actinophytocola sp. NPDC049390 TaxID=3363894 RepID=UPI0037B72AB4